MSKDDDILSGIVKINTRLDDMAKINERVIVLEQSDKQAWRDITDLKKNKADEKEFQDLKKGITNTSSWWIELLKGIIAVVIASLILGFIMSKTIG